MDVYQRKKRGGNWIHPTTVCLTDSSIVCVIILLPMNIFGLVASEQHKRKYKWDKKKKKTNSDLGIMTQGFRAPASGKT